MKLPAMKDPAKPGQQLASSTSSEGGRRHTSAVGDFTPRLKVMRPPISVSPALPGPPLSARSQPGSSRKHRIRVADGMSPRTSAMREAESVLAAERQLDSYVTAVSKETLLSEQYTKETALTRERIKQLSAQLGPRVANPLAAVEALNRSRARAMKRTASMEVRLSELLMYNARLVEAVNALRKRSAPHRQSMKKALASTQKRHADMQQAKCHAIKALDERDRYKAQLRMLRDEAAQERNHFANALDNSEAQLDQLEDDHDRTAEEVSAAAEAAKKQQFLDMKKRRANKEKLDVRYGYLRSQLTALDGEFRKLERIVGVHFMPGDPASLENIISNYIERETHIVSLQKFWARQNEEAEAVHAELVRLQSQAAALGGGDGTDGDCGAGGVEANLGAAEKAAASVEAVEAAAELAAKEADAKEKVAEVCRLVARLFRTADCEDSFALGVQGCSASTVQDFLSAVEAKLDSVEIAALELRANAQAVRAFADRPQNEVLGRFVDARTSLALSRPGESLTMPDRKNLPSVADQDLLMTLEPGDAGAFSTSRQTTGIDQRKVGEDIEAWKQRQIGARSPQPGMNRSQLNTPRRFKASSAGPAQPSV